MNWRLEKTSGHGHLVDWGIHLIDACRKILDLSMPLSVTAAGGIYTEGQDHDPRHVDGAFRVRQRANRVAAPPLGAESIAGDQQRHLLLWRRMRRSSQGLELDFNTAGEIEAPQRIHARFDPGART